MTLSPHLKHLILAGLGAVVLVVCLWKVAAWQEGQAHDQKVLAEDKLKNDLQIAKTQAQATQTDSVALQNQVSALAASNSALKASLSDLRSQMAVQRQKDAALAPEPLAGRWQGIVGVGQVTATPQGLLADLPAAHATVDQLEQLPEVKSELVASQANGVLKDQALVGTQQVLVDTQAELGTCKKVTLDSDLVCTAKLKEQAAKARKHSLIYSTIAFIAGVFVRGKL